VQCFVEFETSKSSKSTGRIQTQETSTFGIRICWSYCT